MVLASASGMRRFVVVATGCVALAACASLDRPKIPDVPVAASYKEAGRWAPAQPADRLSKGSWWTIYQDSELDALALELEKNSPDLAAAYARYQQVQALGEETRSALYPTLGAAVQFQPSREANMRPPQGVTRRYFDNDVAGLTANYDVDLWGAVHDAVVASDATTRAAAADLESARLSLVAQMADAYIQLRGLDAQIEMLRQTVAANQHTVDAIGTRHTNGIASGLDLARAQTQLQAVKSQLSVTFAQRAALEHQIAVSLGRQPSSFSIEARANIPQLPEVPAGIPSELLQRRPDIAAAERRIIASNASLGVAKAAWFPTLNLTAQIGYESYDRTQWVRASNLFWALGPTLAVQLLDGGLRDAQVAEAQGALDASAATYRSTVLNAFAQVEDNLALINHFHDAIDDAHKEVAAAERTLDLATKRYEGGIVNFLEVATAQAAALQARRDELTLETQQLRSSVALIHALGGGWSDGDEVSRGPAAAPAAIATPDSKHG